jgi:hypothetical protein
VDSNWRAAVWGQFGAAIDMLENAIVACPDSLWAAPGREPEFWRLAYHTLFWLDLYLSEGPDRFAPPAPFTLHELDSTVPPPARPYSREELLEYLQHGRRRCREVMGLMTDAVARRPSPFEWLRMSRAEALLYNLRHVQHGAAQLNLRLRQSTDSAPPWVARAAPEPGGLSG